MTKQIRIDPDEVRATSTITCPEIPVNAYQSDPTTEAELYQPHDLVKMYEDMLTIREFETVLENRTRHTVPGRAEEWLAALPPGAFIVLGFLIAAKNAIDLRRSRRQAVPAAPVAAAAPG